jgi:DNA polymerase-3 subunit epsilon
VHVSLEWLALRAALTRRRAMWLTRLVDASVVRREPSAARARLMVIERGEIVRITSADPDGTPPIPPGYQHSVMARRELFTIACFDRLRVLTTELKRLVAAGVPVALRFGIAPALADARLAAALWWV